MTNNNNTNNYYYLYLLFRNQPRRVIVTDILGEKEWTLSVKLQTFQRLLIYRNAYLPIH